MSASKDPHTDLLRELASLMVAVAGESVTMVKRSAPDAALKLKQKQEWDIYLEFLQVLFNLADRMSVMHLPIQSQPLFMDSLEDAVSGHLKTILAPALGPDSDDMEVTLTIGKAVAESRQRYERFRFLATEDSAARAEYFKFLSDRIADQLGAPGNGMVISAATLCASSAVSAMATLFESLTRGAAAPAAEPAPQHSPASPGARAAAAPGERSNEIKLVSVMATVAGEEVETRWGLHPRFRQDLKPEEAQELTRLMNRVTQILGERYAAVAFTANWASSNRIGHA